MTFNFTTLAHLLAGLSTAAVAVGAAVASPSPTTVGVAGVALAGALAHSAAEILPGNKTVAQVTATVEAAPAVVAQLAPVVAPLVAAGVAAVEAAKTDAPPAG